MDLSVIIITLNNKKILEDCLTSIKKFTKGISYETLVTDNGSTDGTEQMLKEKFPSTIHLNNKKNLGFSKANNKGIQKAQGRYVLILNDDTYIRSDAFTAMIRFMDKSPEVGICGPKLLYPNGNIQEQGSIFSKKHWASKFAVDVQFVIGACLLIRKEVISKIGSFDENLFFYNDDLDLCLRAKKAGYKVAYFPIPEVYHYGGFTSKKTHNMAFFVEGIRGGLYFCKKHYNRAIYWLYRAFLLAADLFMLGISALIYPFKKDMLPAYLKILKLILTEDIMSKT